MCSDENSKSVGLIGLGLVGSAIAEHLLGAGHRVIGYDIDPAACQALRQRGGHVVGSPAEVAAETAEADHAEMYREDGPLVALVALMALVALVALAGRRLLLRLLRLWTPDMLTLAKSIVDKPLC